MKDAPHFVIAAICLVFMLFVCGCSDAPDSSVKNSPTTETESERQRDFAEPASPAAVKKSEESNPPEPEVDPNDETKQLSIAAATVQSDAPEINVRVAEIFQRTCFRCHGEGDDGGIADILDVDRLIADELISRNNAEDSVLWQKLKNDEMPPGEEQPRPTADEVSLIKKWIDSGTRRFRKVVDRPFVRQEQALETIEKFISQKRPRDRSFYRFITITHLYNAAEPDENLRIYRLGLMKLLNSLSWNQKLVQPNFIDAEQTILAIDLRDFVWNERIWDRILEEYPYRIKQSSSSALYCYQETGTSQPTVTGDWLISRASRPPLYHDILQLPETEVALEHLLHVESDIPTSRPTNTYRAGFLDSGVSENNRIIERKSIANGAYWKSFDFGSNSGRKNILKYPLGPGTDELHFEHDGGEIIFSLPNGLHAYMLVNRDGNRIDKGPVEIVRDLSKKLEPIVTNGISCMSCHNEGMIDKQDEVRQVVSANPSAYPESREILDLYPESKFFDRLLQGDREEYKRALVEIGFQDDQPNDFKHSPIVKTSRKFEANLDLKHAAAELDSTPEELLERIEKSPLLGRELGILRIPYKTVKREVFLSSFAVVARELGLGVPYELSSLAENNSSDAIEVNQKDFALASLRRVERYLDLPNVPKSEDDELEYVIDDQLNPVGRFELSLQGLAQATKDRCEVEYPGDKPDHLIIKLLPNPKSINDKLSNPLELAEFVVEGRELVFRWKLLDLQGQYRSSILPYQQACRETVLSVRENDANETRLIALQGVNTIPAVGLQRIIERGDPHTVMRWPRLVVPRNLYFDNLVLHIGSNDFAARSSGNESVPLAKLRFNGIDEKFNLGEFESFFAEIGSRSDGFTLNADSNPSLQKLKTAVIAAQKSVRDLSKSLAKANRDLAAAQSQLSAASSLPQRNAAEASIRAAKIQAANANLARAQKRIPQTNALLIQAKRNLTSFEEPVKRFEPFVQFVARGYMSCTIFRLADDVRVDVAVIEPPQEMDF